MFRILLLFGPYYFPVIVLSGKTQEVPEKLIREGSFSSLWGMGDVKAGVGVRKLTQQFQQLIEQTSTSTDSKLQKQQTIQPVKSRDKSPAVQSYKPEQGLNHQLN